MSEAPRSARWLDRLSAILLAAALIGVGVVAAPALTASAPPPAPPVEDPPAAASSSRSAPSRPGSVSASDTPPRFDLDGEPRVTELERQYPDGMWPGHAKQNRSELPGGGETTKPRSGTASAQLTLRVKPDATSKVEGVVPAGEKVMVIRVDGNWALVVHRMEGIGWAPRSQVAIQ